MRTNGTKAVLIVDGDRDAAATLAMLVLDLGHLTRVACDPLEGIRLAEDVVPDIIMLNLDTPGLDGYAVADRLRKDPRFGNSMLVALSGDATAVDRERSMLAGFDDHLTKPVDRDALKVLLDLPI